MSLLERRPFLKLLGLALSSIGASDLLSACGITAPYPNILLITADDLNWDSLGISCAGAPDPTPNLDRLAAEGMRFERAHVASALCIPSRSALFTGLHPHNNGAQGFEPIRPEVTPLTEMLYYARYRNGIIGKVTHLRPIEKFFWQEVYPEETLGRGRDPAAYHRATKDFIGKALAAERPFFLMANIHDPHRPFHGSDAEKSAFGERLAEIPPPSRVYRPEEVRVPGFLPDLPEVRIEIAQYYSSVRRCDDSVGAILKALEESGVADHTIVLFLSDNGMSFPFAKTTCYPHGTRTPLIVRWPGRVPQGKVDRTHFISGVDLLPTLLDMIGMAIPLGLDGASHRNLMLGRSQAGEESLVTSLHATAAERLYPTRALHHGRYVYIYNAWSNRRTEFIAEPQKGLTWSAMLRAAERDPGIAERVDLYLYRTREELYDLESDPDALTNLAQDPGHREVLEESRDRLLKWMAASGDWLGEKYSRVIARLRWEGS